MAPTILGPEDAFVSDPEDWPASDSGRQSPDALNNEADDLASTLPDSTTMPPEADEADVIEQRRDAGPDEEDETRSG